MNVSRLWEPRDRSAASRSAAGLLALAGLVTGVFGIWNSSADEQVDLLVLGSALLLLVLAGVLYRINGRTPDFVWTALPALGVVLITVQDLMTSDSTAAGQIFFCLPVLYAASQLRGWPAYGVLVLAVTGSSAVAVKLLPPVEAVPCIAFMATALSAVTYLLVSGGDRQERLTSELRRMAAIDPLTGLVTRRVLDEAAQSAMAGAERDGGTVLVLVDIDNFKTVNDGHGHPVGDKALIHIAGIVQAHSRQNDVICRMGGDEIAVLMPGCAAQVGIERAHEIVAAVLATPMLLGPDQKLFLTVSVGVAHVPTDGIDLPTLYKAADACLYDAKIGGRNQVGYRKLDSDGSISK